MKKISHTEWIKKGKSLFGKYYKNWCFVCPACGHKAKVKDFVEKGLTKKKALEVAPYDCIGRYNNKGISGLFDGIDKGFGCDWSANGLLRTLDKGYEILKDGKKIYVFDFYEEE